MFAHDPEAVIINDAFVNHSDHRATGLTVVDAIYPAARDRLNFPEHIEAGLEPHKVKSMYIWGSERANYKVGITDLIDAKLNALRAHESQFEEDFVERVLDFWKDEEGHYIESFRRVLMSF